MIPAACCILAAVIMCIYPINVKRTREIDESLKISRAKGNRGGWNPPSDAFRPKLCSTSRCEATVDSLSAEAAVSPGGA